MVNGGGGGGGEASFFLSIVFFQVFFSGDTEENTSNCLFASVTSPLCLQRRSGAQPFDNKIQPTS